MAIRVNPTRMELSRLKKRLATAVRGHKLLKDKRDEMVRQFMLLIRRNKELRDLVETSLGAAMRRFAMANAQMGSAAVSEALLYPARQAKFEAGTRNIMSVNVPWFSYVGSDEAVDLPYGFAYTSAELDGAVIDLANALPQLIELAEVEKTCNMLAIEIERTRRRVNALEYVMIPEIEDTIRTITMKLDENERGSLVRLMKSKEMIMRRV